MSMSTVIGIDIGGTSMKGGLVTAEGEILTTSRVETVADVNNEAFLASLWSLVDTLLQKANEKPVAVGIGSPGPLDTEKGIIVSSANLPGLKNCPLTETISMNLKNAEYDIPVFLENDANCAALGQAFFGYGKDKSDFAVFTLGTGVGGGLFLNNTLYRGYMGNGFEIGHITIFDDDFPGKQYGPTLPLRTCGCGAIGCLETIASATGVSAYYAAISQQQQPVTSKDVFEKAQSGDATALQVYRWAGEALGLASVGLVHMLNLDTLIFTGGMAAAAEFIEPHVSRVLKKRLFQIFKDRTKVVFTQGDENAGILGAAALAREQG